MPKNHRKFYTISPNSGWWNKQRDLVSLERYQDIGRKAVLNDVKTALIGHGLTGNTFGHLTPVVILKQTTQLAEYLLLLSVEPPLKMSLYIW